MTNSQQAPGLNPPVHSNSSNHHRAVALSLFEHERATTPLKCGNQPWSVVIALHSQHAVREKKSGPMLGGYALNGQRKNSNVSSRAIINLDVDSEGEKDHSGRLLRVTRSAPDLETTRTNIAKYEWIANSTHWHEPGIGANKYRVTMLPDRDYLHNEHVPLLEALDELLGGCLDRNAWAWSQAFFTPSCPPHAAKTAFVFHNQGVPVPVDEFVARGRQIIAQREQLPSQPSPNGGPRQPEPDTPLRRARLQDALRLVSADTDRNQWRDLVWAILSTGWPDAAAIAKAWSETAPLRFEKGVFDSIVASYDPRRVDGPTLGTVYYTARKGGWNG